MLLSVLIKSTNTSLIHDNLMFDESAVLTVQNNILVRILKLAQTQNIKEDDYTLHNIIDDIEPGLQNFEETAKFVLYIHLLYYRAINEAVDCIIPKLRYYSRNPLLVINEGIEEITNKIFNNHNNEYNKFTLFNEDESDNFPKNESNIKKSFDKIYDILYDKIDSIQEKAKYITLINIERNYNNFLNKILLYNEKLYYDLLYKDAETTTLIEELTLKYSGNNKEVIDFFLRTKVVNFLKMSFFKDEIAMIKNKIKQIFKETKHHIVKNHSYLYIQSNYRIGLC